jgi:hypothetical protein
MANAVLPEPAKPARVLSLAIAVRNMVSAGVSQSIAELDAKQASEGVMASCRSFNPRLLL